MLPLPVLFLSAKIYIIIINNGKMQNMQPYLYVCVIVVSPKIIDKMGGYP